jgi:rhodanese-related sulfurtransferase
VRPEELAQMIQGEPPPVIVDVRAAGPGLPLREKIPGARHIELASVETVSITDWPNGVRIVTYCDCPNDVSASKAARVLAQRGLPAGVLAGGLSGWVAAGFPLETV